MRHSNKTSSLTAGPEDTTDKGPWYEGTAGERVAVRLSSTDTNGAPPTMPGSPWNGNAGTDRSVEHLIFDRDPIGTGEHHEMLLFIAVKVQWQAATGSCNGFNNRICDI